MLNKSAIGFAKSVRLLVHPFQYWLILMVDSLGIFPLDNCQPKDIKEKNYGPTYKTPYDNSVPVGCLYSCDVVHYCSLSVFGQLLIVSLQNFNNGKTGQTAATFSLTACCFSTFFLDLDIDVYWTIIFTALQFLEFDNEIIPCHNTLVTLAVVQNSIHKTTSEHPPFLRDFGRVSCCFSLNSAEPLHTRSSEPRTCAFSLMLSFNNLNWKYNTSSYDDYYHKNNYWPS